MNTMRFLLIDGTEDNDDRTPLAKTLATLGTVLTTSADAEIPPEADTLDGIIIVDATHIAEVETLVARLRAQRPVRKIVVMTASPTWQRARAAFEAGAIDYLPKIWSLGELRDAFAQVLSRPLPPWPR